MSLVAALLLAVDFAGDGRQLSPYFIKNIIDVRDPPCFYSVNMSTDVCEVRI